MKGANGFMGSYVKNGFGSDFLWGASSSAYQVEGANLEDGKGLSCQDIKKLPDGTSDLTICADEYHHYKEDVDLMAQMGLKAYRFSIAWTRILPNGIGEINPKGIIYYNNLINECLSHGIQPIVTILHFDMPAELNKKGGWSNSESIDWYKNYAKILFKHYGDRVKYWLTINEQNIDTLGGGDLGTLNISPEFGGSSNHLREIYQQNHNMFLAQAEAMKLCHEMLPDAKIGPAPNMSIVYPASSAPKDFIAAQNFNCIRDWLYFDVAVYGKYNEIAAAYLKAHDAYPKMNKKDSTILRAAEPDFLAFNYYYSTTVSASDGTETINPNGNLHTLDGKVMGDPGYYRNVLNSNLERTQWGWEIDPIGFRASFRELASRYHLPMLVTENGLGAYDKLENGKVHDNYRIDFLRNHIVQMKLAADEGCKIIGYCPWSNVDLVSTHEGMKKRYGLIYVDRQEKGQGSLKRYPKDSFYWYKKVISSNGKKLE
jgi:6-phospho-beta-glucosidase